MANKKRKKQKKGLGLPVDRPWTDPEFRPAFNKALAALDEADKSDRERRERESIIGPDDLNTFVGAYA